MPIAPASADSLWKKVHAFANRYEVFFALWLLVIVLRLPSLAEPYWYGDEAIYLTIGNALRHGQDMYAQIVDHKTPFIYYFAMVPNQFWFRILMTSWMMATTSFFYGLAHKFFKTPLAIFSSVVFVLLTSWSSLEGNIPNGELFVMGFILAGLYIFSQTTFWTNFFQHEHKKINVGDYRVSFLAGVISAGGILTKVPGIFDVLALGSVFIWLFALGLITWFFRRPERAPEWKSSLLGGMAALAGIALPLLLSVLYYTFRGTFDAYLQFGLLYNFHYTGNWTLPFAHITWLAQLFTLPGKGLLTIIFFLLSSGILLKYPDQRRAIWLAWWTWLALFASLLSNRPYPHYMLQIVPPLALLIIMLWERKTRWLSKIILLIPVMATISSLYLLDFQLYPFLPYYQNYVKFMTGRMDTQQYAQSFNTLVIQNDEVAQAIVDNSDPEDRLFIWGTNPMLYALTKRVPACRFTVAFHIHDLKVYDQTLSEIKTAKPEYIVVMKNEQKWPEFSDYLESHYIFSFETTDMLVYRKSSLTSLLLLQ